jgi:hypothetical protein
VLILLIAQSVFFFCTGHELLGIGIKRFSPCRTLLNYLGVQNIKATFFVVGSRVVEFPKVLIEEYMAGHEISVHTWSHHAGFVLVPCYPLLTAFLD